MCPSRFFVRGMSPRKGVVAKMGGGQTLRDGRNRAVCSVARRSGSERLELALLGEAAQRAPLELANALGGEAHPLGDLAERERIAPPIPKRSSITLRAFGSSRSSAVRIDASSSSTATSSSGVGPSDGSIEPSSVSPSEPTGVSRLHRHALGRAQLLDLVTGPSRGAWRAPRSSARGRARSSACAPRVRIFVSS